MCFHDIYIGRNLKLQFLRHATFLIEIASHRILIDPMLSDAATLEPVQDSGDERRNPLVPLPIDACEIIAGVNAVLVTHTHRDHWDTAATNIIPKACRIICQPEDAEKFHEWGYDDVRSVYSAAVYGHLAIYRTGAKHGTGEIGKKMGTVSGYMLKSRIGESIYFAGDSIWCVQVQDALMRYRPAYTVVNCGGAQFLTGGPITMTAEDVATLARIAPFTKVIAVHMEAFSHCGVTRKILRNHLCETGLCDRVLIPKDGDVLEL